MADVVVIGYDGGTWDLLQPWMDAGKLPTLARLQREAAWGRLASTVPPVTFPAWKAYSTGKNPGKLGVYWWARTDFGKRRLVPANAGSFRSEEYWDVLGRHGHRVGVIGMPSTFPPKRVNGFLVAGAPVIDGEDWTYPPSLARELKAKYDYSVSTPGEHAASPEEHVAGAVAQMRAQCRFARDRLHDVDLLHVTLFAIDNLQHLYWDRPRLLLEAWQALDEALAAFVSDEHLLLLMSDHGFTEQKAAFFVNHWLEREGFLATRDGTAGDRLATVGVTRDRLTRWTARLGLRRVVPQRVRERVGARLVNRGGLALGPSRLGKVDWARTIALADAEGPLYVKDAPDKRERVAEIRERLLADAEVRRFVRDVKTPDALYEGPFTHLAPDLVLIPEEGVEITGALGSPVLSRTDTTWKGTHHPDGLWLARGPGVTARGERRARITDLAPTILRRFGVPAPRDLDGAPLPLEDHSRGRGASA